MSQFVAFVALEGTLTFPIVTRNTSAVPTNADSAPTYSIYADPDATALATGTSSSVSGQTGVYRVSKAINESAGFEKGETYSLVAAWAISSSARKEVFTFTVT